MFSTNRVEPLITKHPWVSDHPKQYKRWFIGYWAIPLNTSTFWKANHACANAFSLCLMCWIKFTSFDNRRDIIWVWSSMSNYRMHVEGYEFAWGWKFFFCFDPFTLRDFSLLISNPKWRFVNSYIGGTKMKGYVNTLNLQGWKWWESEHMLSKNLSVCSPTYLT